LLESPEGVFDQDFVGIICGHSQQLKHLQICEEDVYTNEYNGEIWKGTPPGSLPSLKTLEICGCGYSDEEVDQGLFSLCHLLDLLHWAPNLVECVFWSLKILDNINTDKTLVLLKLRRLIFGSYGVYPDSGDDLIGHLTLPRLKALVADVETENLVSFLKSSPHLLDLVLGKDLDIVLLVESLHLVPYLRRFRVWYCRCEEELFAVLIEFPSLLPHLITLVIHLDQFSSNSFCPSCPIPSVRPRGVLYKCDQNGKKGKKKPCW
jgi:hypothetical protein